MANDEHFFITSLWYNKNIKRIQQIMVDRKTMYKLHWVIYIPELYYRLWEIQKNNMAYLDDIIMWTFEIINIIEH